MRSRASYRAEDPRRSLSAVPGREAGRNYNDRALTDLIGEQSSRSDEFANRWAAHNGEVRTTAIRTPQGRRRVPQPRRASSTAADSQTEIADIIERLVALVP